MVDDDLADTAELELMDTDVMEQLPDAAAKARASDGLIGSKASTNEEGKGSKSKPGFDPYNHS